MLSISDVNLRDMVQKDLEMVLDWRNSESVRRSMLTDQIITLEDHKEWFRGVSKNDDCEWMIAEYEGQAVGVVSITEIKRRDATCTWGMYIGSKFSNIGIGVLMEIHAIDRMVGYHRIRKIWGQVLKSNRIMSTHKRFGFEVEGVFKEHVFRNNAYEDVVLIALFSRNWQEKREQMVSFLNLKED